MNAMTEFGVHAGELCTPILAATSDDVDVLSRR